MILLKLAAALKNIQLCRIFCELGYISRFVAVFPSVCSRSSAFSRRFYPLRHPSLKATLKC